MKMKLLSAALLAASLCFGSVAHAQEEDGFPFPPAAPAADPVPVNPAVKNVESGRVIVVVGSERHYGYAIGELMPVTVVISVDSNIKVNLESVKRKILTAQGSDFELAETPIILEPKVENGKTVYTVILLMRSWVIQKDLVLNVEFHYATDMLPDGKTPNWKPVTTPDFVVTTSNVISAAEKDLIPGDMTTKESAKPYLVRSVKLVDVLPMLKGNERLARVEFVPLDAVAVLLMSLLPLWLLGMFWNRVRPGRKLSASEKAWVVFDRVAADATTNGGELSYENLNAIAMALREYLGVAQTPTSQLAVPLSEFYRDYENKAEMLTLAVSALTKLDRGLFSKTPLTGAEKLVLVKEIERLVPRV